MRTRYVIVMCIVYWFCSILFCVCFLSSVFVFLLFYFGVQDSAFTDLRSDCDAWMNEKEGVGGSCASSWMHMEGHHIRHKHPIDSKHEKIAPVAHTSLHDTNGKMEHRDATGLEKMGAALFYGISSIFVIFANKIVLSTYAFPHFAFVAGVQFLTTSLVLFVLSLFKAVDIPRLNWSIFKEVFPVSFMFFGNVIFGLGSTQSLNLPMFTALRRFSIMMTMLGEYIVLSKSPSSNVVMSVALMIIGALIAACNDLAFDLVGYIMVFINNLFTGLNGVYLKKASISTKCSKMGVLYYSSAISAFFLALYISYEELSLAYMYNDTVEAPKSSLVTDVLQFEGWRNPTFIIFFLAAAFMGSILNYSIFLCTSINSALTTAVVGCLKNILVTYFGMIFLPGYQFNWMNFIGLNISIVGSLYYTMITLQG